MVADSSPRSESPFKFLDSYSKEDKDIFLGREKETEEMYQKIFDAKILLVYGISGTGKTSIIDCGLANKFEESDWLPVSVRRGTNINDSLLLELKRHTVTSPKEGVRLNKLVQSLYLDHFKPVYIIFDQFEELFIFGKKSERDVFISSIRELIDSDIQCRIIFSIREEYLAELTEFEKIIPDFLDNRMRIERMTRTNAINVIEGPCRVYRINIEDGLPEKIIDKLGSESNEVELTYLQVLLDRLLKLSGSSSGNISLKASALNKTGDVSDIIGSYLDDQLSQMENPDMALTVLKSFVSIKGTKRQVTIEDVQSFMSSMGRSISNERLLELFTEFVNLRVLRGRNTENRYELRHDSLASRIYEKISLVEKEIFEVRQFIENAFISYQKRKTCLTADDLKYIAPYEDKLFLTKELDHFVNTSKREIRKGRRRLRITGIAAVSVLFLVLSAFTVWALKERQKAAHGERIARANSYNYIAKEVAEDDPTMALRIAEFAYGLDSANSSIRENIRRIYYNNNFYRILLSSSGNLTSLDVSPDGRSILVANDSGRVYMLNKQGVTLQSFAGHSAGSTIAKFSPDGSSIITGSEDSTVRIWDIKGNTLSVLNHDAPILDLDMSADGETLVTAPLDSCLYYWNRDGHQIKKLRLFTDALSVRFFPDRDKVLIKNRGSAVAIVDPDGIVDYIITGLNSSINDISISPDGRHIVTGHPDNTAKLWNISGKLVQTFHGHDKSVKGCAFSPDGSMLLTSSEDMTIRLWDMNGNQNAVFKGHTGIVTSVDFADGSVISLSKDNTLRRWHLEGYKIVSFGEDINSISFIKLSPDDKRILGMSGFGTSYLWDTHGNKLRLIGDINRRFNTADLTDNSLKPFAITFSGTFTRDGRIVVNTSDFKCKVYDQSGEQLIEMGEEGHKTNIVVVSDDNRLLATSSQALVTHPVRYNTYPEKCICIWNFNGELLSTIPSFSPLVYSLCFSPDSKILAVGSNNGFVHFFNVKGEELSSFKASQSSVNSVSYSPDSKFLLTAGGDQTARIWDSEYKLIKVINGHTGRVNEAFFSPDGKYILTASDDYTVRLWDIEGNQLQTLKGHTAYFTNDSRGIVTLHNGIVSMWDIKPIYEDFQSSGQYQEMTEVQKLDYGLLSKELILKTGSIGEMFNAAQRYASKAIDDREDISLNLQNAIQLLEQCVRSKDATDSMNTNIAFWCNMYSWLLIEEKEYNLSLRAVLLGIEADPDYEYLYTNLPLAYLFTGEIKKAKKLYIDWMDLDFDTAQLYRDIFLIDILDLESQGNIHPEFDSIKEILAGSNPLIGEKE